jgi:hypothetical protein
MVSVEASKGNRTPAGETYQLQTRSRSHGIVDMGFEISAAGRSHSNNGISHIVTAANKISPPTHMTVTSGFKYKFLI